MAEPKFKAEMGNFKRVLLVEDDPVVGPLVKSLLEKEGYQVNWVEKKGQAHRCLEEDTYHLIVLDINLPDGNGLELCKEIRKDLNNVPVIVLTSMTDEDTVVKGLSLGANDYLRKPFGKKELLARVHLQLRGKRGANAAGPLQIDLDRREAKLLGVELKLTRTEFHILAVLSRKVGDEVSREMILSEIDPEVDLEIRTLDSHVSHLRKKLQVKGKSPVKIASVYKVGYRLEFEKDE